MIKKETTAVIYARVFSVGDGQSTERQVNDLTECAEYKGMTVLRVLEEHISGAKVNGERPVLCEAMDCCGGEHAGIVLVSELSRLGRNALKFSPPSRLLLTVASTSISKKSKLLCSMRRGSSHSSLR